MSERKDKKKVQLFVKEIIENGVPIDNAILFGSCANNNYNSNSDIDVALVSPKFNGFGFEDRKFFSSLGACPHATIKL